MRSEKRFTTLHELEVEALKRVSTEHDEEQERTNQKGRHKRFRTEVSESMAKASFGDFEIPSKKDGVQEVLL